MDLFIVIYSAEILTCKVARIPLPPTLQEGMMIFSSVGLVQVEKLVWIENEKQMFALCGFHSYYNGDGELGGTRLYFPFGRMSAEVMKARESGWKDLAVTDLVYRAILAPVQIVGTVENSSDVYIV